MNQDISLHLSHPHPTSFRLNRRQLLKYTAVAAVGGLLYLGTNKLKASAQLANLGEWQVLPFTSQLLAVHAILLNTGQLLFIAGSSNNDRNYPFTNGSVVIDPNAPDGNPLFPNNPVDGNGNLIDLFCCGHTTLPDGRVLIAGGTLQYDNPFEGRIDAVIFDPASQQFTVAPSMAGGRWYPTLTSLGDGRVLAVSGLAAQGNVDNRVPEIYAPTTDNWQALPESPDWPLYSHNYLMADGRIFYAGAYFGYTGVDPSLWDIGSNATVNVGGLRNLDQRGQAASVLLPPAQAQRVMVIGGNGGGTIPYTDIVDLTAAVQNTGPANFAAGPDLNAARTHHNAVLLPDRTVLVCGGSGTEESAANATLTAELYDPYAQNGGWVPVALASVPRLYHSGALLLPDGRVMTFGGNPARESEELRLEVYSPPYLFAGAQPVINDVPQEWGYGGTYAIQVDRAGDILWAHLIRPGSTTHAFDMNQRLVDVPFTVDVNASQLVAQVSDQPNLAPPGWYMLFVVDQNRIPSTARWIRLG